MLLQVLGSSSNGNCYLLRSETTGEVLVIEAGVRFIEVKKAVQFNLSSIVGCIVSHEHGDHSRSVSDFINACIPCYMSQGTEDALHLSASHFSNGILPFEKVQVGSFKVLAFPVQHDAKEPFGFLIQHEECGTVLFATDTYYLQYNFPGLNNVMLECNYRKDILDDNLASGRIDKRRYDRTLKSHLSYDNCIRTLQANDLSQVCNIFLIHLSDSNSNAREFTDGIKRLCPGIDVSVAISGLTLNFNKQPY